MGEVLGSKALSPFAKEVLSVLEGFSTLALPILRTQCLQAHVDPANLQASNMPVLAPLLCTALGRFTSPKRAGELKLALASLAATAKRSQEEPKNLGPPGVTLGLYTQGLLEILGGYTPFAWPLLETQCRHLGLDPAWLSPTSINDLAPKLAQAVARWTNPYKGESVLRELMNHARRA